MLLYDCKREGATLIEIVIAVMIMACSFLPILRVVAYGSVNTSKVSNYSKATRLAQELIEECKHVPFKVYQKQYSDLGQGEKFSVNPQFYKETQASIEKFKSESKDVLKEFTCTADVTVKKNELNQINELWFEVEMVWKDLGNLDNSVSAERKVRAGNAYFNTEAY